MYYAYADTMSFRVAAAKVYDLSQRTENIHSDLGKKSIHLYYAVYLITSQLPLHYQVKIR